MFIPRKFGTAWLQRIFPDSGFTPMSAARVKTTICSTPWSSAMIGDEKAPPLAMVFPLSALRHTIRPVFFSTFTRALAAWT